MIVSTGPLGAPVSKYARIAARLRHRVRPNVDNSFNPLGTPDLILLISLNIRNLPSLATGSDIGGSTRIPATFCGVVVYKAPYGVVPGLHPSTMDWYRSDSAMARTVGDALLMHNVIAGQHALDPHSLPFGPVEVPDRSVAGARIVVSPTLGDYEVDAAIRANLASAASVLESQGAVIEHRNPDWTVEEIMTVAMAHYGHTLAPGMADVIEATGAEVSPYITQFIDHTMAAAAHMPLHETFARETRIREELGRLLSGATALLTPVTTKDAFLAEAPQVSVDSHGRHYWADLMAVPFNICNRHPALAVPTVWDPAASPPECRSSATPTTRRPSSASASPWRTPASGYRSEPHHTPVMDTL